MKEQTDFTKNDKNDLRLGRRGFLKGLAGVIAAGATVQAKGASVTPTKESSVKLSIGKGDFVGDNRKAKKRAKGFIVDDPVDSGASIDSPLCAIESGEEWSPTVSMSESLSVSPSVSESVSESVSASEAEDFDDGWTHLDEAVLKAGRRRMRQVVHSRRTK
jgi:hypothetical protein